MVQEILTIASFIVANAAVGAITCDWLFFKGTPRTVYVTDTISCVIYDKEAYNMFGAVCGVDLNDIESYAGTLQILLPINLVLALLMFFLIVLRRLKKRVIKSTSFIILLISMASAMIWTISDRERLPSQHSIISYYGAGWFLSVLCACGTIPMFFII
jgi:glucan phosphoethanolaminetransferase (alkaline phosphatase superfamily)